VNEKQQLTKPSSVGATTGPALEGVDAFSVSDEPGPDEEDVLTPEIPAPMTPVAEDPVFGGEGMLN
jgi:hypothetical protein